MLVGNGRLSGSSLIELLIAMGIGFASLTAMSSLIAHGIGLNSTLLMKSRLEEEINAVLSVIEQDVKRAGYTAMADDIVHGIALDSLPFRRTVNVAQHPSEAANSCMTFAYDKNQNGSLDEALENEEFGYRLRNHTIEMRVDGRSCAEGFWQDITDPNKVKITKAQFEPSYLAYGPVRLTQIRFSIEAEIKHRPELSQHSQVTFMVENYD